MSNPATDQPEDALTSTGFAGIINANVLQDKERQMTTSTSDSKSLFGRMVRAAKLDVNLYEEVEADTKANWQAFRAVVLVSMAPLSVPASAASAATMDRYGFSGVCSSVWAQPL